MAAKNDILRDKDGNQIFPATMAEQVSYDGKMNVKQAIKRGAVRNKVAPTVASMTDKEQIYVYTGTEEGYTFGNWYYWDGTAWTSGGVYNAIEVNTDGTLTEEGAPADAKATGLRIDSLKDDLFDHVKESQKAIEDLNDKKITKFYTNSLGEKTLNDSDNGLIVDMKLYGRSLQDGTPTPDSPIEIQSVVNPKLSVRGKNLFKPTLGTFTKNGVTCTNNGDGTYTLNGTSTSPISEFLGVIDCRGYNKLKLTGCPSGGSASTYWIDMYFDQSTSYDYGEGDIETVPQKRIDIRIYINSGVTMDNLVFKPMITTDLNATYDGFEPYKEQTATLPYTLNAIPVSSGGNVTIDNQQYIADYVDIENKKLHRYVEKYDLGSSDWSINNSSLNIFNRYFDEGQNSSDNSIKANILCSNYLSSYYYSSDIYMNDKNIAYNQNNIFIRDSSYTDITALKNDLSGVMMYFILNTPTITDLTDEEVQAFKDLHTYYPTTNIINSSDQLDGFTTFNYPVSLKNGWEYVKQQIGDTREYIYDMELQSAEAYVNSEYAVALTELGV